MRTASVLLALAASINAAEFPSAEIANDAITAKLYLPDAEKGYYRGTRFDWSGVIYSLRTARHEYFGQWFPKYDPRLHDAIMGPVEEFRSNGAGLGYEEAQAGGTFIRIGVGVVRKPDEPRYQSFKTYEMVDPGRWEIDAERDRIRFVHHLRDQTGYGYRYTKTIRLKGRTAVMVIEHSLRNTGKKRIETSQYNHNFFVIDGQPSGPDTVVRLLFELRPVRAFRDDLAEAKGREIHYNRELQTGQSVFGEFHGFGPTAADYDIRVENRKAGAGVRITGDRPLETLIYWSIRTVFSPEPYIYLAVDPGREERWTYTYEFQDLGSGR
jgi:hypothetical protein